MSEIEQPNNEEEKESAAPMMGVETRAQAKSNSAASSQEDGNFSVFYTVKPKSSSIYLHTLKESKMVYEATEMKFPKVAFTQKGRVFLLGGTRDEAQTDVLPNNLELVKAEDGNTFKTVKRAPMKQPRVGFGCLVDNYGENLYVVGGSIGAFKSTNKCEYYNVETDTWHDLPNLND